MSGGAWKHRTSAQQRLVLAKGIEGAELSGSAVIVSEGGQCHITVLPDELKNLLHADYYELTLWADGADGITVYAELVGYLVNIQIEFE